MQVHQTAAGDFGGTNRQRALARLVKQEAGNSSCAETPPIARVGNFAGHLAVVHFQHKAAAFSGVLTAGGLSWQLSSESRELEGFGELRDGVVGDLDDGSHLEARSLALDLDSGAVTLAGDASVDLVSEDGPRHAEGQQLTLARDEQGRLVFARAEGDVLLSSTDDQGLITSLRAATLTEVEGALVSSGVVTWERDGARLSGTGLRWERDTGLLTLDREVTVAVDAEHPSELSGLSLTAEGGARWQLPAGEGSSLAEARGTFSGPVLGRLPDGRGLQADELVLDGPGGELVLQGRAQVTSQDEDSRTTLGARRLTVARDEAGRPASLFAREDVTLVDAPLDGGPAWHLACARLDLREGRAVAPGQVVARRGESTLVGFDLVHDGGAGSFTLERDTVLTLSDGTLVSSPGGLRWTLAEGADAGPSDGFGELRGPVTGQRPPCTSASFR